MKVIIAGCRDASNDVDVAAIVEESLFSPTEIVSGGCRGADKLGERYAKEYDIPVKIFPANWEKYGKSAGPRRNQEMVDYANALILLWDGASRGSWDVLTKAFYGNLDIHIAMIRR